jgi:putative ABC transport system substrate-binding protein
MRKIRRRRFLVAVGGFLAAFALLVAPLVDAQTGKVYRVGYLSLGAQTGEGKPYLDTFLAVMRNLGYVEGRGLVFDHRWADGDVGRAGALADELIALKPDVLVGNEAVAQIMRAKTASIPIVLTGAIDPVKAGLAQSLRRPGMNVTGVAQLSDQLPVKHIELMREISPRLSRVGQLVDTTASGCKIVEQQAQLAARRFGLVLVPYYVTNQTEIERAFSQMENERPDVLLPCPSAVLFHHRNLLFDSITRLRIPMTSFIVTNVPQGVLFAYATSLHENFGKAATYVDRILKGAKPGELPIEQPTNFELVINLKTAKALNLVVPRSILVRADRVIE